MKERWRQETRKSAGPPAESIFLSWLPARLHTSNSSLGNESNVCAGLDATSQKFKNHFLLSSFCAGGLENETPPVRALINHLMHVIESNACDPSMAATNLARQWLNNSQVSLATLEEGQMVCFCTCTWKQQQTVMAC